MADNTMRTVAAMVLLLAATTGFAEDDALRIERLTWAGIKMVAGDTTILIDAIGTDIWNGNAPGGMVPVTADTGRRYALVTHAHNDHLDVDTLRDVLGERGYVILHESIAANVASRGLQVIPARLYEPVQRGGFIFTAVPAEDGFGAAQVSWIVRHGDRQYLHAGDTLWHGQWGAIGAAYGPFDAVFLPINAARLQMDPMPETAGTMSPVQAADAATLLRAERLVPIHYGNDDPPYYVETDDPLGKLIAAAAKRELPVVNLLPGEFMRVE